jgi:TPR repeat protein
MAAALDEPAASFDRAVRYYRGIGVGQDFKEALTWYLRAAREGFPVEKYRMSEWQVREPAAPLRNTVTTIEDTAQAEAEAELLQVADPLAELDQAAMRRLQRILTRAGYDPGPVDGMLGPKTRAAFERFQEQEGALQTVTQAESENTGS